MTPDRCGTGHVTASLTPGDRQAVEQYGAFLRGDLAYDSLSDEYVDLSEVEGNPNVVMARKTGRQ